MSKPKPTAAANSFPESRAETQASALLAFPPGPSALPPGLLLHLRGPVPRAPGFRAQTQAGFKIAGSQPGLLLHLRGPVPWLPARTLAPPPRPGALDSCSTSEARCPGCQPGLLLLLRGPVPWTLAPPPRPGALAASQDSCGAESRGSGRCSPATYMSPKRGCSLCQKCFFFGFLHAQSRRSGDTFSASKTSLSFRTLEDSTFEQAEGSLLWKSTSFQVLCPFEQVL